MSQPKPQRIPRPRHLFPELAAFLIEWKRVNLRAGRNLQRAIGHVPIWVTGSLAGIMGIMLAISLFFVHEPQLQAAAAPVSSPAPIPQFEPQPTLAVSSPVPQARLLARIFHTNFPFAWDENRIVAHRSSAPPTSKQLSSALTDLWRRAQMHEPAVKTFASYLTRAAGLPANRQPLVAADVVSTPLEFPPLRAMGIVVEKTGDMRGSPHEPLTYQIVVRNTSDAMIENLGIHERISALARVTEVLPAAGVSGEELVWNLESLPPNASRTFLITLVPETDGQIETVTRIIPTSRVSAVVRVRAAASPAPTVLPALPQTAPTPEPLIQSVPGAPALRLTYTEVKPLKQGDTLSMIFAVTNVGTAAADDVILFVRLSGEFEHRYGEFVKHQIGTLQPGQARRALLQATARDPGNAHLDASLTMQGTEKEARELKIPIQSEPLRPGKLQPVVQRPILDQHTQLMALEQ